MRVLSYTATKNRKQRVYDLIDLGAEVSKTMFNRNKNAIPTNATGIAATKERPDGTEMVRIF
jgi:hypothetical protein